MKDRYIERRNFLERQANRQKFRRADKQADKKEADKYYVNNDVINLVSSHTLLDSGL